MSYSKFLSISPRGQLVLPKKVRDILKLGTDSLLKLTLSKGNKAVVLEPMTSFTEQLEGSAKGMLKGKDAVDVVVKLREER